MQGMGRKADKYRFDPTVDQACELVRTCGCVRSVYNQALALLRGTSRI